MGTQCEIERGEALASSEMAIRLYCDLADNLRRFLIGVTGLKPPIGYDRQDVAVDQAGTLGFNIPTLPRFQPITAKLDWQPTDADHAELSNRGLCAADYFQDMWLYARRSLADPTRDIIWIPNHIQFPNGGFSVKTFSLGEQSVNGKWMVDFSLLSNIQCITAFIHLFDESTPDFKFTTGANDTITRTSGSFETDGIKPDMKVFVDDEAAGLPNYRKIITVDTVAPLLITAKESGVLVDDPTGAATTVLRAGYQL